ncbi:short-chain dehydrogenase [Immersiella caudata]|uniref:Short-chain dehydrogenase n=1 Tax=Immersiella caudata TaxID=314043 RepID=A0AA39WEI9_9PEZI|nr:short-chain dehydrogenase [Immersiella caudata]
MARIFIESQFCTKTQKVGLTPETSLSGKTALITGGSDGIGLHAGRHFLSLSVSRLILAVRSPEKGERVASQFRSEFPSATVDVWPLEMTSYDSIQALARRASAEFASGKRLDIAILNAGIVRANLNIAETTGHCDVIQVNYISTFLLAILLIPILRHKSTSGKTSSPGRLTIVNSGTAYNPKFPNRNTRPFLASFDDPNTWVSTVQYPASKALGHLFMARLLDHLPAGLEDEVIINLVDPGYCKGTGLHRDAKGVLAFVLQLSKTLTARSQQDGAWTYVDAAVTKGKESHGCFVMDFEIKPFASLVYDPAGKEVMDALWDETMAELSFAGVEQVLESLNH